MRDREAAEAVAPRTYVLPTVKQATLKQQYREAAQRCHPDRVAEAHRPAATATLQQLQDAYQRQDEAVVAALLTELRAGRFAAAGTELTTVAHLRARRDVLAARHVELLHELVTLRGGAAYTLAGADEAAREAYLTAHRAALLAERNRLTALLTPLPAPAAGAVG